MTDKSLHLRSTLGGVGMMLHESAGPLVDLLNEIGVDIGSTKLRSLARFMGAKLPQQMTDDMRCVCVGFATPVGAFELLQQVRERLTPEQLGAVGPLALCKLDEAHHLAVFMGAVGLEA